MSKLIDKLRDLANRDLSVELHDELYTISPNVLKHIKIAELQDELVELGFKHEMHNRRLNIYRIDSMRDDNFYHVQFWNEYVYVRDELFYYNSPTFHEDVINKVKELMK